MFEILIIAVAVIVAALIAFSYTPSVAEKPLTPTPPSDDIAPTPPSDAENPNCD